MVHSPLLKIVVLLSVATIVLFPLYAVFVEYPSFSNLLADNTTKEAVRVATILSSILIEEEGDLGELRVPAGFMQHLLDLQKDSRIIKVKIFTPAGRIIYSTDPDEIGRTNEEEYFRGIVSTGSSKVQQVEQNAPSLERQIMPADVVETYVPIMKGSKMIGVFEIYYDITAEKQALRSLIKRSAGALFLLAVVLLAAVSVGIRKSAKIMEERKRIEDALMESEKRYRMLFEHAGESIFILEGKGDRAGRIVAANQAAAVMHGYTRDELLTMKITDLDTPDAAQGAAGLFRRILNGEWVKAEITHCKKDGTVFPVEVSAGLLELGDRQYIFAFDRDITTRRHVELGREKLIGDLQEALIKIKTLKGLLPICASCKKIRDDQGYWKRIEEYIATHSEAEFTHGLCPDCAGKLFPEMNNKKK